LIISPLKEFRIKQPTNIDTFMAKAGEFTTYPEVL
jgi:hypothetical protein